MSAAAVSLRIIRLRRLAAGNVHGPEGRIEVTFGGGDAGPPPAAAVAAWLDHVSPGLAFDFLHSFPAEGPADGDAAVIAARLAVALLPRGRKLPFAILPGPDAGQRLLAVAGESPRRLTEAIEIALEVLPLVAAGRPAPDGLRARIAPFLLSSWDATEDSEHWILLDELRARAVPWRGVRRHGGWWTQVGEGRRARNVRLTMTDRTSRRAAHIGGRKDRAWTIFRRHGLPVPEQRPVASADEAVAAARAIGLPVVVKRVDSRSGLDVHPGLGDLAAVRAAFEAIPRRGNGVVVEGMIPGEDHRLLVIDGRMVAAARKTRPLVTGDGRSTIAELLAQRDREPLRLGNCAMLAVFPPRREMAVHLAAGGRTLATVPAAGERVVVHSRPDLESGVPVDVTHAVHPDNRDVACQAAALIGLDVAGVDFICPDISLSWHETGGGICEINRMPGLLRHATTAPGMTDVAAPLADYILAGRPMPTIPIAVLLGEDAADDLAAAAARHLTDRGWPVGIATGRGLEAAGLALIDPGAGEPSRVERLIADPAVGAAIVVVPAAALLARGLGHMRVDLAAAVGADAPEALAVLRRLGAAVLDRPDAAALAAAMGACASA